MRYRLCTALLGCCGAAVAADTSSALVSLPLEQLMQFQIESVSRHPQPVAAAPASVSIVTATDIRTFGYRTLAEILDSMRGLNVSYDRNYSYLGVRGFAAPGDYNTRVLLLVDGVRHSDEVYDQAALGTDFGIDPALIERVEFIAGPSSAVYGSNALAGVINVVTKTGADYRGANIAVSGGSYHTAKARATVGDATGDGSWLLSASRFTQRGQDLYYPEFDTPEQNDGVAEDADYDRATRLFGKYQRGDLVATFSYGDRTKGIPTASFDQTFDDSRARTVDTRTTLAVQYQHALGPDLRTTARVYGGEYHYLGNYIYDDGLRQNRDITRTQWYGGELQGTWSGWQRQQIVTGVEYRYAPRVDQENFDVDPRVELLDDRREHGVAGFYLQDEIAVSDVLAFTAGARADRLASGDWVGSPRLAAVYRPEDTTAFKLLHGTAYRAPNAYEQYYYPQFFRAAGLSEATDSGLRRERMVSNEFIAEHALGNRGRLSLSLFRNEFDDLIALRRDTDTDMLFFANDADADTRGAEIEWQNAWTSGQRLQIAYSWQQTRDSDGDTLLNSPRQLLKVNLSGPLLTGLTYGINVRAVSRRQALRGDVPGHAVVDLTLNSALSEQWELSASLHNALDRRYADPGSSEHVQKQLPQDERNFVIRLDYWL